MAHLACRKNLIFLASALLQQKKSSVTCHWTASFNFSISIIIPQRLAFAVSEDIALGLPMWTLFAPGYLGTGRFASHPGVDMGSEGSADDPASLLRSR